MFVFVMLFFMRMRTCKEIRTLCRTDTDSDRPFRCIAAEMTPQGVTRASDVAVSEGFPCDKCGVVLKTRRNRQRHLFTVHRSYPCPLCNKSFNTEKEAKVHVKLHSNERGYKCSLCPKAFQSVRALWSHKSFHAKQAMKRLQIQKLTPVQESKKTTPGVKKQPCPVFKCPLCPREYVHQDSFKHHLQLIHHKRSKKVPVECQTKSPSNKRVNMIISIPVQVSVFPRNASGVAHQKDVKESLGVMDVSNTSSSPMRAGEKAVNVDRPFKCSLCEKAYSIRSSLSKHVRQKHGVYKKAQRGDPLSPPPPPSPPPDHNLNNSRLSKDIAGYQCGSCDKVLYSLETYKSHLHRHSSQGRFRCALCSKVFPSASKLWIHQNKRHIQYRHDNLQASQPTYLFPCSVCHRAYRTITERDNHMKATHGPCSKCGRVLSSTVTYKAHMNIHLGRKPFKCNRCSRKFYSASSLKRHKCLHQSGSRTRRKPATSAAAPEEGSNLLAQDTMALKTMQKMSIQPVIVPYNQGHGYKCVLCGKVLARCDAFRSHMNLHTGARPHKCKYCNASFTHSGKKQRHVRAVHFHSKTSRHTSHLQTAKKPAAQRSGRSSNRPQPSDGKTKEDILTKNTTGQQKENHDLCSPPSSEAVGTDETSALGPSFSCGLCGVTMRRYASYMAHMTQHTGTHTPDQRTPKTSNSLSRKPNVKSPQRTPKTSGVNNSLSRKPNVKSPQRSNGMSCKVDRKRHICTQCGRVYSQAHYLKKHMYVAHPLPRSFRMQLRRPGLTATPEKEPVEPPQADDMYNEMDIGSQQESATQCSGSLPAALDNHVVDDDVTIPNVLPVCGEVRVEGGDETCITDSHSDTVLVKYGSWNVFFFGENSMDTVS